MRDDLAALLSERFATTGVSTRAWPGSPRGPRPLPVSTTTLFGREQEIGEVAGLLARPGVRLVTLTGPGGVGKTRLAVAVAGRLRESFGASTVFVSLAVVTDPGLVLPGIGRAVGADLAATPLEALAERLGDERWLLILDNLEQVVGAAADLGKLLARGPGVVILATSRIVLGLQGEREYPVPPLPVSAPADPSAVPVDELMTAPTVALFVDRAQAVRPDFALTQSNAAAVAEICLEAHSTVSVTLCMIAFARLAFAEGDPDRAALLAGAAEGLRRRLGLRAWPMLRQGETELISQIRQAAGPDRFSKMTQAGSRLSRQEAVDAIWHQRGTDTGNPAAGTKSTGCDQDACCAWPEPESVNGVVS